MSKRSALSTRDQRLADELLVDLVREVLLERAAVERELAGAGHQADADDRFLAPADGLDRPVGEHRRDGRDGVETLDLDVGVEIGVVDLDDDLVLDGRGLGLGRPRARSRARACSTSGPLPVRSLRDLVDLVRAGLLRGVGVLGARVDLELLAHRPAEAVLRQHALDRLLDQPVGLLLEHLADGALAQTTRVAGVAVDELVGRACCP